MYTWTRASPSVAASGVAPQDDNWGALSRTSDLNNPSVNGLHASDPANGSAMTLAVLKSAM